MSVGALIEFYFKLIICITIPEEPEFYLNRIFGIICLMLIKKAIASI
ncbi:MAG: hypothetical protein O9295_09315 [Microcystis sp. LE18-22.4A]|nr:hypothetical protein [Microcystis sp. LE18-22.4A]MCZ8118246.1 hypothetical protein [Microcystis sp. LE18-22.4A]